MSPEKVIDRKHMSLIALFRAQATCSWFRRIDYSIRLFNWLKISRLQGCDRHHLVIELSDSIRLRHGKAAAAAAAVVVRRLVQKRNDEMRLALDQ